MDEHVQVLAPPRLSSLDAFRGFTMFWIVGGKGLALALAAFSAGAVADAVRYELTHSSWAGLRYYDLIWPSFMLMVGVSIPFAFAKRSQTQTRGQILGSAFRRAAILFLLGSLRTSMGNNLPTLVELSSALQPIAVAYLAASLLAGSGVRIQAAVGAGLLVVAALLLGCVPGPGFPAGSYAKDSNLVAWFDLWVLGPPRGAASLHVVAEGWGTILTTIPAISTTIGGLLIGELLRTALPPGRKAAIIALGGIAGIGIGFALSPWIPIIMKLWTVSYGLASAGWACVLFAACYWIIDVGGWKRWSFPLTVIGANALAIYVGVSLFPFTRIAGIFARGIAGQSGRLESLLAASLAVILEWLVLFWMYRRKLFLRA